MATLEKVPEYQSRVDSSARLSLEGRIQPTLVDELIEMVPRTGADTETTAVESPLNGQPIAQVPLCSVASVRKAVRRARRAQQDWAGRSVRERAAVLFGYHDLILAQQNEILDLIQIETGKARKHAFEEIADVALVSRYYASNGEKHLRSERRKGALPGLTTAVEHHPPLGVVGVISPWNYPLTLAVTDALAALMAGNGVVLKPDRLTPLTALWAVRLLQKAGLPYDLFQVVTGAGSEIGAAIIDSVDFVTFTGSTQTGKLVAREAGARLVGCSLELGGKNAMFVLGDADLDQAVEGAIRGCFSNAGQLCIATERLFVERGIYQDFLDRFVRRTTQLKLRATLDYSADVGSLISARQLEVVEAFVVDAVDKGAEVLTGGRARPDVDPYFYEPTVLVGVTESMAMFAEETFGPVVAVAPFDDVDSAIEQANATEYGLNASIWTGNLNRGARLAKRLEVGTVNVNEAYAAAWASVDAPMGGFKASGLGRRHGAAGIRRYTETQTVAVQRLLPIAAPEGVDEASYSRVMTQALKVLKKIPGLN